MKLKKFKEAVQDLEIAMRIHPHNQMVEELRQQALGALELQELDNIMEKEED